MATFAKKTFDVANYLRSRPTYPASAYQAILAYHASNSGHFARLLDLGCGPGFLAQQLAPHFSEPTVALDPSEKFVQIGLQPANPRVPRVKYGVGSGETLRDAGIGEGGNGVDLVVAGQAAHWFDYPKVWAEFTRVVRPGGTVIFLNYAELCFPNHPRLTPLITHHSASPTALGPYWTQPGRSYTEALLDPVPFPVRPSHSDSLRLSDHLPPSVPQHSSILPVEPTLQADPRVDLSCWDASTAVRLKTLNDGKPWLMEKMFTLETLEGYMRTFSSLHAYHEKYPEDAERKGRGAEKGDIVDRFVGQIKQGLQEDGPKGQEKEGEILGGWPLVMMAIKKRW